MFRTRDAIHIYRVPREFRVWIYKWWEGERGQAESYLSLEGVQTNLCTIPIRDHEKTAVMFEQIAKDIREAARIEDAIRNPIQT